MYPIDAIKVRRAARFNYPAAGLAELTTVPFLCRLECRSLTRRPRLSTMA